MNDISNIIFEVIPTLIILILSPITSLVEKNRQQKICRREREGAHSKLDQWLCEQCA